MHEKEQAERWQYKKKEKGFENVSLWIEMSQKNVRRLELTASKQMPLWQIKWCNRQSLTAQ